MQIWILNLLRDLTVIGLLEYHPALACGFPGDLLVISKFWTWWSQAKSKPENSKNESIDSHITSPLKNGIEFPVFCIHHLNSWLNSPPWKNPQDVLQHQLHPVGSRPGYPLPPARQPLVMATVRPIHRDPKGFAKSLPAFAVCDVSLAWFLGGRWWKNYSSIDFYWGEIHEMMGKSMKLWRIHRDELDEPKKLGICDLKGIAKSWRWILAFGTCVVRFRRGLDMGQIDHDQLVNSPSCQQPSSEDSKLKAWWGSSTSMVNLT